MFSLLSLLYLLLPFQFALNPAEGFDVAIARIVFPIVAIFWIASGLLRRKIFFPTSAQTLFLLSFLFLSAFSLFFADEVFWGMRKLLFPLSFFPISFVLADMLQTQKRVIQITKAVVFGAFALAIFAIVQFVLQFFFPLNTLFDFWTKSVLPIFLGDAFAQSVAQYPSVFVNVGGKTLMRAVAIFPDPHMLSFFLGMSAPLAIGLAIHIPKKSRLFFLIAAIMLLADLLTFSRGGYFGILGGLLFLFLCRDCRAALAMTTLSKRDERILFASLIGGALLLFTTPIGERFLSGFNAQEGSNQGRVEMWRAASDIIAEHPFFGTGLGNYPLAVLPSADYRTPIYAHNLFLDIAAETGIAAAIFFLLLLFSAMRNLLREGSAFAPSNFAAISLVVFLIHSLVETPLYSAHILPLFIFLLALGETARYRTTTL